MKIINNELYKYKHVVKIAIGLCKLASKVEKIKTQELARFVPLYEDYKQSDEYLKLQSDITATDDEEDYKKDQDPKGFKKYHELLTGKLDFSKFIDCCARLNPDCGEMQYAALKYFLLGGKLLLNRLGKLGSAVECFDRLGGKNQAALVRLQNYCKGLTSD